MRHCQIQCNFEEIDDVCKLGKEYLIALTCKLCISFYLCPAPLSNSVRGALQIPLIDWLIDRQNFENFNILHAFLSLVVAKLSDLKNSPVFRPTLYFYSSLHTNLHD